MVRFSRFAPALVTGALLIAPVAAWAKDQKKHDSDPASMSDRGQNRITREVRHELVMLPYYGVFDNLAYRVDGSR